MADYTITFKNGTSRQIKVLVDDAGDQNFSLEPDASDQQVTANNGDVLHFWWRGDGNPTRRCDSPLAPCSRNQVTCGDSDMTVVIADPPYLEQIS